MAAETAQVRASVVVARPGAATCVEVQLATGSTLRDAIVAAGVLSLEELARDAPKVGVFSELRSLDEKVADGDRIEVYRSLTIDPKEARRLRAALRRRGSS
jgi:putative ubiquitin-RnfH superfamily antitoxin RatB of RatAB toxin-antitoxin module